MYKYFFKRLIDILLSFIGIIVLLPLISLLSMLLLIANNGTLFFIQPRPGKDYRIFKIIKFKTMKDKRDKSGNLLSDEQRLTSIGKFLRKASLDEIPQLFNVIKGEMSLIGPRPLLIEYLARYNDFQKLRHIVKPGITGWAQVNGRNTISWGEKFKLDVWYVNNLSFSLDCKIFCLTVLKVMKSEGINQQGEGSMKKFTGNSEPSEKV